MAVRTGSVGPPIRANTFEPEVLRQMFAAVTLPGVYGGSGALAVAQHSTPNMSVDIAAGNAAVLGTSVATTQGMYWFYNDALVNLAVAASHATLDRIDIVVAQIQDAFYAGGSNVPQLAVVTGTPAGSPVAPATPASSLVLATISVIHASASVLNANITDNRPRPGPVSRLGYSTVLTQQSPVSAVATVVTGIAVTLTHPAGRRIRYTLNVAMTSGATACPTALAQLVINGVTQLPMGYVPLTGSSVGTAYLQVELTPAAGTYAYAVSGTFGAGTANAFQYGSSASSLLLEDLGPA